MVLRLDPGIPLVWRDPFTLQFGVDPVRVVLREVTTADELLVAALATGINRSGLSVIGQNNGADERDVERLLGLLTPLLVVTPQPALPPAVAIVGTGDTANRIAETLIECGATVDLASSVTDEPCDVAITIGQFVLEPATYGFWLRRDVPHLPIVFGEAYATIGPMVDPGRSPCLYCLEFHHRDADQAWAAIASQLWGRAAPAETPLVSREVSALAARLVLNRLRDEWSAPAGTATSLRIAAATGEVTQEKWMPHPECGCISIPGQPLVEPALAPLVQLRKKAAGRSGRSAL
jgi:bacteriocin biosynthesis cyclodehydratase domain-containing protein